MGSDQFEGVRVQSLRGIEGTIEREKGMKDPRCESCAEVYSRRSFLRVGSLSFFGVSLSQYLALQNLMAETSDTNSRPVAKAQSCILLWLEGGPSHVDTFDPKPGSSFKPIASNVPGIQVSELLPRLAKHVDKLAIIRSLHTEENNHAQATYNAMTGHKLNPVTKFPCLGSMMVKEMKARNEVPPYVMVSRVHSCAFFAFQDAFSPAFLGPDYDPFIIDSSEQGDFSLPDLSLPKSLTPQAIDYRKALLTVVDQHLRQKEAIADFAKMDVFRAQALRMILSPEVKQAFDLSQETAKTKDAYGHHRFGQSVLLARRLVEAGARFVTASGYSGGDWDTHSNNDDLHRDKLTPPLDQALSALLEDLQQRGLLESTMVIVMGEFGRTPYHNPNKGRDHWNDCWSMVLAGGGIRGGQVVGASDEKGAYVADNMVTMGDVFATIYKALGIDWTKTLMSPVGRPVYIANSIGDVPGTPIKELI